MSWLRFRYGVGERDHRHRKRRSSTASGGIIPFDRIQDIDIEQRFWRGCWGRAKVRIETGGGGKDDGSLDTIHLAEAPSNPRRHSPLRRPAHGDRSSGCRGYPRGADPVRDALAAALLLAGLFNFSLFYLAVIGAGLQYLQPLLERNIGDPKKWFAPAGETAAQIGVFVTLLLLGCRASARRGSRSAPDRDTRLPLSAVADGDRVSAAAGALHPCPKW
jgi:putative membrane protein